MALAYIDKVLNDVFNKSLNKAARELSESGQLHHAIVTKDFFKNAYAIGLLDNDIKFTLEDLDDLAEKFMDGVIRGITNKKLLWKETSLGGGGIIISSKPRVTVGGKGRSDKSLTDIKEVVLKGKQYARPKLDEIVKKSGGKTGGKGKSNISGTVQGGLSYGHGEGGGAISTHGTERGLDVVKKINSAEAEKWLGKNVKNGAIFLETFNTNIQDYYKHSLGWDVIRINPDNKKAEIIDNLEITGAFVYQNPNHSAKYDLPRYDRVNKKWEDRFKATLRQELIKTLEDTRINGGMTRGQLKGSPTPVKRAQFISAKQVVEEFEKALKGADMRGVVTVKTALEKIGKTKGKQKKGPKSVKQKQKGITKRTKGTTKKPKIKRGVARSQKQVSPLALKSLLQKALPDAIAKKMTGRPTLMYQTGRFAQSVEIMDIVPMQRQVEISYDYMQDPYRVFEPGSGSPLATTGRDPKKIIGGTIRELAQQIMGSRFLIRTKRA